LMQRSALLPVFLESPRFAVNVLAAGQQALSDRFASRAEDRFAGVGWEPGGGGMPLLHDALARFECAVEHLFEAGDHLMFLGRVERFEHRDGDPLLYFSSRYAALRPAAVAA
ncbi:flavin reductase family protein, partial [Azospirillum sp.]|uniref:flavin reductase family protein n=1 Tax=Azospirillum sp. TaxID=34012 RepID=UPI003D72A24E